MICTNNELRSLIYVWIISLHASYRINISTYFQDWVIIRGITDYELLKIGQQIVVTTT